MSKITGHQIIEQEVKIANEDGKSVRVEADLVQQSVKELLAHDLWAGSGNINLDVPLDEIETGMIQCVTRKAIAIHSANT